MPKLLIISSIFSPNKNIGGVIRISKIIKYLDGFDIEVLCSDFNKSDDDILYNQIKSKIKRNEYSFFDVRLIYVFFKNIYNKCKFNFIGRRNLKSSIIKIPLNNVIDSSIKKSIKDNLLIPDHFIFWCLNVIFCNLFRKKKNYPNIIMATSPSVSNLIIGYMLSIIYKVPLVIDLRDPWTTNPFQKDLKFNIIESLESKVEKIIFTHAKKIIVVDKSFINPIIEKYKSINDKFLVVPNGYDEEDFKNIKIKKRNSEIIKIVHTGNFYPGRDPLPLIKILNNCSDKNKYIKLELIGSNIDNVRDYPFIKYCGKLSHVQAINKMLNADILLLVPGVGESTMTGKIFEYIAAKKKILCISHNTAASKLIKKYSLGICFEPFVDDSDILLSFIHDTNFKIGKVDSQFYNRKYQAKIIENELFKILEL